MLEAKPAGNYMFRVNNKSTRTRYEICSKFEHIPHLVLLFLLLIKRASYIEPPAVAGMVLWIGVLPSFCPEIFLEFVH